MRIRQLSIKDGIFFLHVEIRKKKKIFKGQLMNAQKHLMCCETTVVGLKLSEDGVNKHRDALKHELIMSDGKHIVVHDIW